MTHKKRIIVAAALTFAVAVTAFLLVTRKSPSPNMLSADQQTELSTYQQTNVTWPKNPYNLMTVTTQPFQEWKNNLENTPAATETTNGETRPVWVMYNPVTLIAGYNKYGTIYTTTVPQQWADPTKLATLGHPVAQVPKEKPSSITAFAPQNKRGFSINPSSPFVLFGFPILLVAAVLGFIYYMQRGALTGGGKLPGQTSTHVVAETPATRFSDVAGVPEAVEELEEVVDMIHNREYYASKGIVMPRGALLYGPPGTGKTLLARAVAGEAGVPFYATTGSGFMESLVGVGAARARNLFKQAKSHPEGAIVFIDEIDAIAGIRSAGGTGTNEEQSVTLNALLTEIDGFENNSKIFVLAATNRPDMLDDAIRRPGRLGKDIPVPYPDRRGREKIMEVHLKKRPVTLSKQVDLTWLGYRTAGMSGADLANLINEAHLQATRARRDEILLKDVDHAIAYVRLGKARSSMEVPEEDRNITAWHEAGHTAVALLLPDASKPTSVSIVPRGTAGGVTHTLGTDNMYLKRSEAYARIAMTMGGRAGEEICLNGQYTSGPHGDLTSATNLAYHMVSKYGMVDGFLVSTPDDMGMGQTFAFDPEVKENVQKIIEEGLSVARETLTENFELLSMLADELLDKETLLQDDIDRIWETYCNSYTVTIPEGNHNFQREKQ